MPPYRLRFKWSLLITMCAAVPAALLAFGLRWPLVIAWLVPTNVLAMFVFAYDKWIAGRHPNDPARRVPEAALLWSCFIGGTIGGILAMFWRRHKTRDTKFKLQLAVIVIVQLALIGTYIAYRLRT